MPKVLPTPQEPGALPVLIW